jgi:hypothetical protein
LTTRRHQIYLKRDSHCFSSLLRSNERNHRKLKYAGNKCNEAEAVAGWPTYCRAEWGEAVKCLCYDSNGAGITQIVMPLRRNKTGNGTAISNRGLTTRSSRPSIWTIRSGRSTFYPQGSVSLTDAHLAHPVKHQSNSSLTSSPMILKCPDF